MDRKSILPTIGGANVNHELVEMSWSDSIKAGHRRYIGVATHINPHVDFLMDFCSKSNGLRKKNRLNR